MSRVTPKNVLLPVGTALLAAVAFAGVARADDAPPPGSPTPVPAPEMAPVAAPDEPPPPPPPPPPGVDERRVVEPGSARGLYAPDLEYKVDEIECRGCGGIPEIRFPEFDPTARFLIPWTGQFNPCARSWSVFAAETLTYDDNIFAREHDIEDDWIWNSSIGFSYRREGSAWWALLTASLTYSNYLDHDENDDFAFYGDFTIGWRGCSYYASLQNRVARLQNPIVVIDDQMLLVEQDLKPYWKDDFVAHFGYECACYRWELSYGLNLFDTSSDVIDAVNHLDHDFSARFDYYVSDKTSVGGYAGARFVRFDDNDVQSDFDVWSGGVTFSWRPTYKLGVLGQVVGTYSDSDGGEDTGTFGADIEATWDATANTSFYVGYTRRFEPSLGAEYQIADLVRVRGTTILTSCLNLNVSTGVQFGDTYNPAEFGAKDYTLWFFDAMLHWSLGSHVGVDLGYQFRNQEADGNGIDYTENRFTIGISAAL
jgi:hypothetical protein